MNEIEPASIAQTASNAFKAAGGQVNPIRDGGAYASFEIKMPTGEIFRIQAEEL